MLSKSVTEAKDMILEELRDNESNLMGYCGVAERVIDALRLTSGLWESQEYSYKACEICEEIVRVLGDFRRIREGHSQSIIKIEKLRMRAHKLSDFFRQMQNDRMYKS